MQGARIALIGDLHSAWDDVDATYFNQSSYGLLLFAGDLGASAERDGMRIMRSLASLTRPALIMPGNNDVEQFPGLSAELGYRRVQADLLRGLELADADAAARAPGPEFCGFSKHAARLGELDVTVIAGRPFARGGNSFSYPEAVQVFGIGSLEQSVARLCQLVDDAPTENLIFFAHNGPLGLGGEPHALWGRDFGGEAGDWGDSDLSQAIAHARCRGRRTLAVVAGHMHWRLQGGGQRCFRQERDATLYVNCARVPRITRDASGTRRYHLALGLEGDRVQLQEVVVTR